MLRSTSNLKKAAYPIKQILANRYDYQESINKRKTKLPASYTMDSFCELSLKINSLMADRQKLATQRNILVKKIKNLAAQANSNDTTKANLLEESKHLKEQLKEAENYLSDSQSIQETILDSIPNLISPNSEHITGDFEVIDYINHHKLNNSQKLDHTVIGRELGILDIASGSRVSGTGHYYLVGAGARLEQALVQYALERCHNWGFKQVNVPHLIRSEFTTACGFKPRDQNNEVQVYSVKGGSGQEDLCLAGTAEIPLASWKSHQTVDTPLEVCAVSRSFRAEAGARGAETKGLYRVHEFTKVEMFMWTKPGIEQSTLALEKLLGYQKQLVADLGVPAQVLRLGPTDMGNPAYEKYDIEAWMPGRGKYGEVTSVSNCTDFQSRRLHTVDKNGDFVHTLNGTAMAVPRIIIAILENNYDPEKKRIAVPSVLHKWMPEFIEKEN